MAIRRYVSKAWLVLLTAAVCVGLDQWTKILVRTNIEVYDSVIPIPWLGEVFQFQHVHNHGAAFGILPEAGQLFTVTAILVSVAILVGIHFLEGRQLVNRLLLGMALGGALGNFIDRLLLGYVTDFIKVGIPGRAYWPNFNIADSCIVVSVILFTLLGWYVEARQKREREAEPAAATVLPEAQPDETHVRG